MANVQGMLSEVGGVSTTQSGKMRRDFMLQDKDGDYVCCAALGRHAHNAALEENNEVILDFAVGTSPTAPEMPGVLWLYDSSHVVRLKEGCVVPSRRSHITLRT